MYVCCLCEPTEMFAFSTRNHKTKFKVSLTQWQKFDTSIVQYRTCTWLVLIYMCILPWVSKSLGTFVPICSPKLKPNLSKTTNFYPSHKSLMRYNHENWIMYFAKLNVFFFSICSSPCYAFFFSVVLLDMKESLFSIDSVFKFDFIAKHFIEGLIESHVTLVFRFISFKNQPKSTDVIFSDWVLLHMKHCSIGLKWFDTISVWCDFSFLIKSMNW